MSYYMGDYYPRGDPGIGSFFGRIARFGSSFIPGVGPIVSKVVGAVLPGGVRSTAIVKPAAGAITAAAGRAVEVAKTAIVKHPVLSAAGAAGALGATMGAVGGRMTAAPAAAAMGACGRGFHISRKTGACVRNRRMNSCNPRALRRAVRRLHSFAKHYRHVVGFVTPHPKKGRMYFRKRKRK